MINIFQVQGIPHFFIKPGEGLIRQDESEIYTIIGSCLAVTLWHPKRRIGGMFHPVLPERQCVATCENGCAEGFRYVDCGFRLMLRQFEHLGIVPTELSIQLFGGSEVVFSETPSGRMSPGQRNVAAAENVLKNYGLVAQAKEVGGSRGRRLNFFVHTGEIHSKLLDSLPRW